MRSHTHLRKGWILLEAEQNGAKIQGVSEIDACLICAPESTPGLRLTVGCQA